MEQLFSFVEVSANSKTGPIPVAGSQSSTCPSACPFHHDNVGGCYARLGLLNIHWKKLDRGEGIGIIELAKKIKNLPAGQLWRYADKGDLPGFDNDIDEKSLNKIVAANKGKRGFTYSHKPPTKRNLAAIKKANKNGFTINLSANSLTQADQLVKTGLPVVTVLPISQKTNVKTPNGHTVVVCPATKGDRIQCANCGLCQMRDRKFIIGFPAHGVSKKKVEKVFYES